MPRRAPPSALILVQGPTPPRSHPKHTLPSVPRPTFHPPALISRNPVPPHVWHTAPRQSADNLISLLAQAQGHVDLSTTPCVSSSRPRSSSLRGPWDHSGSILLPFNIETLLAPLKPVAVSPGAGW